jgi:putative ABC transport system permease protein
VGGMRPKAPSPMWAKAPLVHLHFPRLLLSLALGALLLALVTAAYPLFTSAESSHLLRAEIAKPTVTRYGAGVLYQVQMQRLPFRQAPGENPSPEELGRLFADQMWHPLLGPVISSVLGPDVSASPATGANAVAPIRLFAGTDALDHIRAIAESSEPGVWLADLTAHVLKVRPGDRIAIRYEGRPPVQLPIAGIYRALVSEPQTGYWQAWESEIYPTCPTFPDCPLPTPFALVDEDTLTRSFGELGILSAAYAWQTPLQTDGPLTIDQARSLATFAERFEQDATQQGDLRCCGSSSSGSYSMTVRIASSMPDVVRSVERDVAAIQGPGRVLLAAGILVALIVIAAAGAFALTARSVEASMLFSRGTHPATVAAKSCLEAVIPAWLGGCVGLGLAFLLVRTVRAAAPIGASASREALVSAGLATLVSIALLGTVSAVAFLRHSEHHRERFATFARAPWELALVAFAVYAYQRLQTGGAFVEDASLHVRSPSINLLLFPVLSIAGLAMIGVRLVGAGLRSLRDRSARFASWLYLAIHRLAGGSRMTLLLVTASALCLGIFVQTQTIVRSLETTVDAKAKLYVGSDVQGQMLYETPVPERFPLPITRVTRLQQPGTLAPGGEDFDLLAVDPATLASSAYWNPSLSDVSIQQMAQRLGAPAGDRIPIVLAGAGTTNPSAMDFDGRYVPVEIVARARAFPGMTSLRPLVVADADTLVEAFAGLPNPLHYSPGASTEFWVKGDPNKASSALRSLTYQPYLILTADQVRDIPEIAAVIDSFLVLNGLGLLAALLVVLGMLMYLQARQRSQVVSYGLSLRMGMSHSAHRRSLTAELGAMLCCSYAIGLVLALGAALLILPLLDPLATIPPDPLYVLPLGVMGSAFVAVLAASWMGGWLTNRRAGAVHLGEVMRVAD